jgi:signal transduction histidine kinase
VLEVSDDGIGLSLDKIAPLLSGQTLGVGVASMRARIEDLGGVLQILPQAKGLMIRAAMPRRRASDVLSPVRQTRPPNFYNSPEPSVAAS